jgi:hypothetical protein
MITRQQAIDLYEGSVIALATALDCTRHAIYMWPKVGHIPERPYMKIRYELKPEAFDAKGRILAKRSRKS